MKKYFLSLSFVFLVCLVSASGSYYSSDFQGYYSGSSSDYLSSQGISLYGSSGFDSDTCQAGQDFLLQISDGCEPRVVRSDLLEEQNVAVFCPIYATQLNPLINVKSIDSMVIQAGNGSYPEGVQSFGFHPAQAALDYNSGSLVNSPLLENVGYAVIVLEQQKNESAMPEWIQGTMVATIQYDISDAFGLGYSNYILDVLDENEWKNDYKNYGFWEGKAFVRAENVFEDGAKIGIYDEVDKQITSLNLREGETSGEVYLPGSYCLGNFRFRLDDLVYPEKTVRLIVDGNTIEVGEGDRFLENRCRVREIIQYGLYSRVQITCSGDSGSKTQVLTISPGVLLKNGDTKGNLNLGECFKKSGETKCLAYVGEEEGTLFAYLVKPTEAFLGSSYFQDRGGLITSNEEGVVRISSQGIDFFLNTIETAIKKGVGDKELIENKGFFSEKQGGDLLGLADFSSGISSLAVSSSGEPASTNNEEAPPLDTKINETVKAYQELAELYPNIGTRDESGVEISGVKSYAETGLLEALDLLKLFSPDSALLSLRSDIIRKLGSIAPETYDSLLEGNELSDASLSLKSMVIEANNELHTILFQSVQNPGFEDYGVEIILKDSSGFVEGKPSIKLLKEESVLSGGLIFKEIREDIDNEEYAFFTTNIRDSGDTSSSGTRTIKLKQGESIQLGKYYLKVSKINLRKLASVEIIPNINNVGTSANISFKIGIEKRAIQLSPEKIQERIDKLNETIEKWSDISTKLGETVKGLKTACLATGAILTATNFLNNAFFDEGRSIARKKVMDSWYSYCAEQVAKSRFTSLDACLASKNDEIESEVNSVLNGMQAQQSVLANADASASTKQDSFLQGIFSGTQVSSSGVTDYMLGDGEVKKRLSTAMGETPLSRLLNGLTYNSIEGVLTSTYVSKDEVVQLDLNLRLLVSSNNEVKNRAAGEIRDFLFGLRSISLQQTQEQKLLSQFESSGISGLTLTQAQEDSKQIIYTGGVVRQGDGPITVGGVEFSPGSHIQAVSFKGNNYIVVLTPSATGNNQFTISKVYLQVEGGYEEKSGEDNPFSGFSVSYISVGCYPYESPTPIEVSYFKTGIYAGVPSMVPFDFECGWYAQVVPNLPSSAGQTVAKSAMIEEFYLCNVGPDNRNDGKGKDACIFITQGMSESISFGDFSAEKLKTQIAKARSALQSAAKQYEAGVKQVKINGRALNVADASAVTTELRCQDIMSAQQCQILFNVCDPVVCPSSRCNLGGDLPVTNVVQSGIIGSLVLCLPNWIPFGGDVIIPVCLSGLKAGIDGLVSVFTSYRDCLQANLDSGETIGICDEIHSIYLCQFFWEQVAPFVDSFIPRLLSLLVGQNMQGGGEYLSVQSAWDNAQDSVDFFTKSYALSAFNSFKLKSVSETGSEFCKNSISAVSPELGFLDSFTEEQSPPQFHANFDEIPYTTTTVPPTSQYSVFYHIFAGNEVGAYYKVYLKSPQGSSAYYDLPYLQIDSGYIGVGETLSNKKDLTAPSGYQELCVAVNEYEECGFKQVSTSFAVDYISDSYAAEIASQTDITTEDECTSGTASLYSLAGLNVQSAANEILNPDVSDRGISRVCSSANPGGESSRWVEVGYCGSENIRCWLDSQSVKDTIEDQGIEDSTLQGVTSAYVDYLSSTEGYMSTGEFKKLVSDFKKRMEESSNEGALSSLAKDIQEKASQGSLLFDWQRAQLMLLRARVLRKVAVQIQLSAVVEGGE